MTRTVSISKGNVPFAQPAFIEGEAQRLSASLAQEHHLRGLNKPEFVGRLAHHYADWNALHPFREGNGRSLRAFMAQLIIEAGYRLDQTVIDNDKNQWNAASERSFHGDLEAVKQILTLAVLASSTT